MAGSSNPSGSVKAIESTRDLVDFLETNKLVVLEFYAPWSEPCKAMTNPYKDIARAYRNDALFYTLNVDKFNSLASDIGVEALPTFVLVKDYEMQDKVVGVKRRELERSINSYK